MTPHGTFCWNELRTWDAEKAKSFYGQTLGWTYEPMGDDGSYWICMLEGRPVAGIFQMPRDAGMDGAPDQWTACIEVDDVDARVALIEANGGEVVRAPWDIPGVGRVALLRDSTGADISWMVSAPQPA